MLNIIFCHVGESFPDYIFESLYQTILTNSNCNIEMQIYMIVNRKYIKQIDNKLKNMNIEATDRNKIILVPCEILVSDNLLLYTKLKKEWNSNIENFRNNFWIHTTSRFFYIDALVTQFCLKNVFHIENDVMLYKSLNNIYSDLNSKEMIDKIVAVQDAPNRAICSIVYFPDSECINKFTSYILTSTEHNPHLNDMNLMGEYKDKYTFPDSPLHELSNNFGIYDACAFGQYLGGIDFRNIQAGVVKNKFINPTIGFVNENSKYLLTNKKDDIQVTKILNNKLKMYVLNDKSKRDVKKYNLNALHIHSKQLYLFSSLFDLSFGDFISGDTVLELCDLVITNNMLFNQHKNIRNYKKLDDIIVVKNFNNINKKELHSIIETKVQKTNSDILKLFVYIDLMPYFQTYILPILPDNYKYIIYSHNGDYAFDAKFKDLVNSPKILKIYAQNLEFPVNEKLQMLPIGIARNMFPHGNLETLYKTMIRTYYLSKNKNIYININPNTYPFRKDVLNSLKNTSYTITQNVKNYETYLDELSQHYFCLCVRGNGIDTHRFWESLYLGVIPVIIDNGTLDNFISHIKDMNIPHFIINKDLSGLSFFNQIYSNYFNKELYNKILKNCNVKSILTCDFLKLNNYRYNTDKKLT